MFFLSAPLLLALLLLFGGIQARRFVAFAGSLRRGTSRRLCRLSVTGRDSGAAFCGLRGVFTALVLCVNEKKPGT